MSVTVRDIRRHMNPVEGRAVSDWQIHTFLMMHEAMESAKAEQADRNHKEAMEAVNQDHSYGDSQ